MGSCLEGLGHLDDAEPLLVRSFSKLRLARGDRAYPVRSITRRLVAVYEGLGAPGKATKYRDWAYPKVQRLPSGGTAEFNP